VSGVNEAAEDPFLVLGLPARADLTDEGVRAAWRRIAAATHPDREDGGDPDAFGAAAAAYTTLRTSFGRGEALADLGPSGHPGHAVRRGRRRRSGRHRMRGAIAARALRAAGRAAARPGPALRLAGAAAVTAVAVAVAGLTPATVGLLAGAATWLLATGGRRR
jgi:curved DNA-binding protein CbpA